jgi:hypothetical protein
MHEFKILYRWWSSCAVQKLETEPSVCLRAVWMRGTLIARIYCKPHNKGKETAAVGTLTSLVSHTRAGRLYGSTEVNGANLEVNIRLYLYLQKLVYCVSLFLFIILNVLKVKCPVCGYSAIHTFNARSVFKR